MAGGLQKSGPYPDTPEASGFGVALLGSVQQPRPYRHPLSLLEGEVGRDLVQSLDRREGPHHH